MRNAGEYLKKVRACWTYIPVRHRPLSIGEHEIGQVSLDALAVLREMRCLSEDTSSRLKLKTTSAGFEANSAALHEISAALSARGVIDKLTGELYPVMATDGTLLAQVDRSASRALGIRTQGVHLNGLVERNASVFIWLARRSQTARFFPGHLDNLVGGGQPIGHRPRQILEQEAMEEACIPADLIRRAEFTGYLYHDMEGPDGLARAQLAVFDLHLPENFQPRNVDGKLDGFELYSLEAAASLLASDAPFKFNSALVTLECLVRHEALELDRADLAELQCWLQRRI